MNWVRQYACVPLRWVRQYACVPLRWVRQCASVPCRYVRQYARVPLRWVRQYACVSCRWVRWDACVPWVRQCASVPCRLVRQCVPRSFIQESISWPCPSMWSWNMFRRKCYLTTNSTSYNKLIRTEQPSRVFVTLAWLEFRVCFTCCTVQHGDRITVSPNHYIIIYYYHYHTPTWPVA